MKDDTPNADERSQMERLCDLEFIFVTGKGGVGKSTVSGLVALAAAQAGKRVLIVYPGLSPSANKLWTTDLGHQPARVAEKVDAIAIDPEVAMREYVAEVIGSTSLAGVLFHARVARGLLMGIPGPSDWAILGKAWSLTRTGAQARGLGQPFYDLVILDAPASGDGSGMLRVPQVILELAPAGRLRADAESCLAVLRNEKKSAVLFVTLVEELSVSETEENITVVRHDLKMPLGPVFVNQVLTPRFSNADRAKLLAMTEAPLNDQATDSLDENSQSARIFRVGYTQAKREELQAHLLQRVKNWHLPTVQLTLLAQELSGLDALKKLQKTLAAGH